MALTTKLGVVLNTSLTKALDLSEPKDRLLLDLTLSLADGVGANQANNIFHDTRTLADGANETLALNDGTLNNPFGDAFDIDILKVLLIRNNSADANLLIGGAALTQVDLFADGSDILSLPPGGLFLWTAPNASGLDVGTNEHLKIAHDGTGDDSLTYDVVAIGVTSPPA